MTRSLMIAIALFAIRPLLAADTKPLPFDVKVTGQGSAILFIPGLACSGEVWDDAVKHFSSNHECHVLTLAGFAGVKPVEGPFLDTIHDGIADYIAQKKLVKPAIVGHSIGGYLCYKLGIAKPDLVGPLIAVDGLPCMGALINPAITAEQLKTFADMTKHLMGSATRKDFLKQQDATLTNWIDDKARRERAAKWGADSDQKTVAAAMADMLAHDLRPDLAKIKSRVLLVAAPVAFGAVTQDDAHKSYKAQVESIRDCTIAIAAKSKHFVMYDEPEWLWKTIDDFIAKKP
jgi:pimeloyl-ACP methyl ester carboxylesterase